MYYVNGCYANRDKALKRFFPEFGCESRKNGLSIVKWSTNNEEHINDERAAFKNLSNLNSNIAWNCVLFCGTQALFLYSDV